MLSKKEKIKLIQMISRANHIRKGGLIMSTIKITANQISNEAKKQKQEVLNRISRLGEFMNLTPNPEKTEFNLTYNYLKPKEISAEKIENKAKNDLVPFKNKEEKNIQEDFTKGLKTISQGKEKANNAYLSELDKIKIDRETQVENANADAISKGLGRSTIRSTSIDDVEDKILDRYEENATDLSAKMHTLMQQETDLKNARDEALSKFEIEYAIKLQDQIEKLNQEVTDYNNKIQKYNNDLQAQEEKARKAHEEAYAEDVARNEKRNQEILRFLSKYGQGSYTVYAQEQKINAVKEFVNSLDKATALDVLIEDDSFKNVLGEKDFNKILNSVMNRTEN